MRKKSIVFTNLLAVIMIFLLSAFVLIDNDDKPAKSISKGGDRYILPVFKELNVIKDIPFTSVKNENDSLLTLHLDVYQPLEDTTKNRPALLLVHGGGFRGGDKMQGYIFRLANEFAKRGYVCISVDYRLRKDPWADREGTISDAVSDVMEALDFIRDNSEKYGINKDYIAIAGGSAGGILSNNLCYKDRNDDQVWDKSGIMAFVNLWGSPVEENMFADIDNTDPPTLIVHGVADSIVHYTNTIRIASELTEAQVEHAVFPIMEAGHTPIAHMDEIVERMAGFLYNFF